MSRPLIPAGMTQREMHRLMRNLRAKVYPWMDVVAKVDGSVVVTIHPIPPGEGPQR